MGDVIPFRRFAIHLPPDHEQTDWDLIPQRLMFAIWGQLTPEDRVIMERCNIGEDLYPVKKSDTWVGSVMMDNFPNPRFCVSVYLMDRAYGGPEEGGWYYDCYEPIAILSSLMRHFDNLSEAAAYAEQLQKYLDHDYNKNRRSDIGSVLSEGKYVTVVDRDTMPRPLPDRRPTYE